MAPPGSQIGCRRNVPAQSRNRLGGRCCWATIPRADYQRQRWQAKPAEMNPGNPARRPEKIPHIKYAHGRRVGQWYRDPHLRLQLYRNYSAVPMALKLKTDYPVVEQKGWLVCFPARPNRLRRNFRPATLRRRVCIPPWCRAR